MKIVFITDMYSENMGYVENFLPKAVAKLGYEVHVIASTAQVYFNSPDYKKTYEPFIGPNIVKPEVKQMDGYTLYRLPLKSTVRKNIIRMKGLEELLAKIQPDIIQTFDVYAFTTYDVALFAKRHHIKLFTESHTHASVFNPNSFKIKLRHWLLGFPKKLKVIDEVTVRHYPIAKDVAVISENFFKVSPQKMEVQSLGVDTDLFKPVLNEGDHSEKINYRNTLGFSPEDLVCVYTGRFTPDKNPGCLAQAINYLQEQGHHHLKALFVGSGTPADIAFIESMKGCVVHPFVKVNELAPYYRLADIGVWPKQESTSQLDAMACGLPIIVSDKVGVKERVYGSGLFYEENNFIDLANKILQFTDTSLRKQLAEIGLKKVKEQYSWEAIAKKRILDYSQSLK
jgi:glycosyltransferase involved in cell wall biosynthesis